MVINWGKHFFAQLAQPSGWSLAMKGIAGIIALAGGVITLVSFAEAHRAQISDSMHGRMASIQEGLLSEHESSRIAALRALRVFSTDPSIIEMSDDKLRAEAKQFARRTLIDSLDGAKPSARAVVINEEFAQKKSRSPQERYEMLLALDDMSSSPWLNPAAQAPTLQPDYLLDFGGIPRVSKQTVADSWSEATSALAGFDFTWLRLNKVRLDCLALGGSRFDGAELRQVHFTDAKLEGASFTKTRLEYGAFTGSALRAAKFDEAELMGTTFSQPGSLAGANGTDSCFSQVQQQGTGRVTDATSASFRSARIYEGDFNGTSLQGTRFDGAQLSNVKFENSELVGAMFVATQLSGVGFKHASMEGSSFAEATITNSMFDEADLKNASFKGVRFVDAETIASIARAKSLEGTNFSGVSGPVSAANVCELLKAGAVLVEQEKEWSLEGRPREVTSILRFMSASDRALANQCGA